MAEDILGGYEISVGKQGMEIPRVNHAIDVFHSKDLVDITFEQVMNCIANKERGWVGLAALLIQKWIPDKKIMVSHSKQEIRGFSGGILNERDYAGDARERQANSNKSAYKR